MELRNVPGFRSTYSEALPAIAGISKCISFQLNIGEGRLSDEDPGPLSFH